MNEELTPEMQARLDQMWEEHKTRSGFPYIENIRDVLPAIEGYDEFIVVDKGDYTVINYVVSKADTFGKAEHHTWTKMSRPSPDWKDYFTLDQDSMIRRECRGITFCSKTGDILARKYHKFFNVGEREETLPGNFEMADSHVILDKLDGSMITPVLINDKIEWHTKMGATDVAKQVEEFVAKNPHYEEFARVYCRNGITLIFEWCSRKQQIVLDYAEDQLVLTGARIMKTGAYFTYEGLVSVTDVRDIPVVENFGTVFGLESFMEVAREQKDFEGYVIRFDNGQMLKVKTEWYVQIHKAKEKILQDRHVVAMILDNTLDDVKSFLSKEDLDALNVFETKIVETMESTARDAVGFVAVRKKQNWTKKDFALKLSTDHIWPMDKALIFAIWEDNTMYNTRKVVEQMVRKNINSNGAYAKLQEHWFNGIYR
jgi:RNA ligase